ncbi:hypothetical protein ACQEU6_21155 [Spirillospora sp. CA-108201]
MTDETHPETPNDPTADPRPERRSRLVDGLRNLAAFLETHTDLPVPGTVEVLYSVIDATDERERAEVDRIAEILGVTATPECDGAHYVATGSFGTVHYRAVAITEEWMKRRTGAVDVITSEEWPI